MLIKETADDAGEVRTVAIMLEGKLIAVSFGEHKESRHIEVGGPRHIWFGVDDGHLTLRRADIYHLRHQMYISLSNNCNKIFSKFWIAQRITVTNTFLLLITFLFFIICGSVHHALYYVK